MLAEKGNHLVMMMARILGCLLRLPYLVAEGGMESRAFASVILIQIKVSKRFACWPCALVASPQEKINAIQEMARVESRYLEVAEPTLQVEFCRRGVIAYYDCVHNTVTVDAMSLKFCPGEEMLDAVAHELFHEYEHACIEDLSHMERVGVVIRDDDLKDIEREIEGEYVTGKEDYLGYWSQASERLARAYARDSLSEILNRVEQYRATGNPNP